MKACKVCKQLKDLTEYCSNRSNKDGLSRRCKGCAKDYYLKKRTEISENKRQYYLQNKEKILSDRRIYREENKEKIKNGQKTYYLENKEQLKENNRQYKKKWYKENLARIRQKEREYHQRNKEAIYKKRSQWIKDSIQARVANRLRCRLRQARKNNQKRGSAIKDLGVSLEVFMAYIAALFYDNPDTGEVMTWDNYGEWHLDHIKPLSAFDLSIPEQVKLACHYTNIQPLWALDNFRKSNKKGAYSPFLAERS